MSRRGIALAVLALTVPVAGASAQSGVEDCIAQNGARYTSPEDATTHQYVGPAARCADAQDDDTEVQITPVGGATPGGGKTPGGETPSTPAPAPRTPAAPVPEQPAPVAPTAPEPKPGPAPGKTGTTPVKPPAAQAPPTGRGAAAARQSVATALSAAHSGPGLSSALSPAGVPGSVVIAVLAGLGLAGAGAGMRRLNRR